MSQLIYSVKRVERQDGMLSGTDADCLTPIWLGGPAGSTEAGLNLDLTPMWLDSGDEDTAAEAPTQELPMHVFAYVSTGVVCKELSLHLKDNSLYRRRVDCKFQ